jgi:hypothetical protein
MGDNSQEFFSGLIILVSMEISFLVRQMRNETKD